MDKVEPTYLGDDVYASFDGYHVCLHLNSHDSEPVIYLNFEVLGNLDKYRIDILKKIREVNNNQTNT